MFYSGPYLIVLFLLMFFSIPFYVPEIVGNKKLNYDVSNIRELFAFFILLIFLGFRGYIYSDILSYFPLFRALSNDFSTDNLPWPIEKGFLYYSLLIKHYTNNYAIYQFISVLIDLFLFKASIDVYLPKQFRAFSYVVFYAFYGFIIEVNLLRNVKAILLFMFAIRFIGKSFILYFIFISVACLFHTSSVLFYPLYFVIGKKWNRKIVLLIYFVGLIIYIFQIEYIKTFLLGVASFMPSKIALKIRSYASNNAYGQRASLGFGFLERFCSFCIIYLFMRKKSKPLSYIENCFVNLAFIYFYIFLFFSEFSILVERIPYLFAMGYWICFPLCLKRADKYEKYVIVLYLLLMCFAKVYFYGYGETSRYSFIFHDDYVQRTRVLYPDWPGFID